MAEAFTDYNSDLLPTSVVAYLDARDERRYVDAAALFGPDATVLDDGRTYEGLAVITAWIEESSTEYTYTSTRTGQHVVDDQHTNVLVRLDGNFPGGTVTLRYQFELVGDTIRSLDIEV